MKTLKTLTGKQADKTRPIMKKAPPDSQNSSENYNLREYLELKKKERDAKIGPLPPNKLPITVNSYVDTNTSTTIVEMLPSPDSKREDENLRRPSYAKRYREAAEQDSSKLGEENKRKDLIGPFSR